MHIKDLTSGFTAVSADRTIYEMFMLTASKFPKGEEKL